MQTSYSNHLCAAESGSGEGSQWRWQGDWITQGESLGCREWEVLARSWKPHATCVIVVLSQPSRLFPLYFLSQLSEAPACFELCDLWTQLKFWSYLIPPEKCVVWVGGHGWIVCFLALAQYIRVAVNDCEDWSDVFKDVCSRIVWVK